MRMRSDPPMRYDSEAKEWCVLWEWRKKFIRKRDQNNAFIKGDSWFKLAEMNGGDWWAWRAVPEIRNGQTFYPEGSDPVNSYDEIKLDRMLAQRQGF